MIYNYNCGKEQLTAPHKSKVKQSLENLKIGLGLNMQPENTRFTHHTFEPSHEGTVESQMLSEQE